MFQWTCCRYLKEVAKEYFYLRGGMRRKNKLAPLLFFIKFAAITLRLVIISRMLENTGGMKTEINKLRKICKI